MADAGVITQVTDGWKDFRKPMGTYQGIGCLWSQRSLNRGSHLATASKNHWSAFPRTKQQVCGPGNFLRRLTGIFSASLVFADTLAQGKEFWLRSLITPHVAPTSGPEPVIEDLGYWLMLVALNIITGASFSLHVPWKTRPVELEASGDQTKLNIGKKD
jgi:hypothetical protein